MGGRYRLWFSVLRVAEIARMPWSVQAWLIQRAASAIEYEVHTEEPDEKRRPF